MGLIKNHPYAQSSTNPLERAGKKKKKTNSAMAVSVPGGSRSVLAMTLSTLIIGTLLTVLYISFHSLKLGIQPDRHRCDTSVELLPVNVSASDSVEKDGGNVNSNINRIKTTGEEYLRSLVIVSGISTNHFIEIQDMIGSIHYFLPSTRIIIFDLGLNDDQIQELKTFENVQLRKHNYEAYPQFKGPGLGCYAFKPQIIHEVLKEHEIVFWMDSSIRLIQPLNASCMETLNIKPLMACKPHLQTRRIVQFTHESTLKYLNITREDALLSHVVGYQAGCILYKRSDALKPVIDTWFECTLHEECICGGKYIPPNACEWDKPKTRDDPVFIGCHRFDQAALALIVGKEFGMETVDKLVYRELCSPSLFIHRGSTGLNEWTKYIRRKSYYSQ